MTFYWVSLTCSGLRPCRAAAPPRRPTPGVAVAAILAASVCTGHGDPAFACADKVVGGGKVVEVVDAATLRLDDGSLVRLVGALPPDVPAWWKEERPWPPAKASREALRALTMDREIELRAAEGEASHDRHERRLAQAFIAEDGENIWVQGRMIESGFSRAYSLAGHTACARVLQRREDSARQVRAGLWKRKSFTIFDATATQALLKRRGTYQLVEGRVHSVGHTRKWSFINFSDDWKSDFTIAVAAAQRKRFEGGDAEFDALQGKRIRARGWIERWNGPVIKATHPEQLEIIR